MVENNGGGVVLVTNKNLSSASWNNKVIIFRQLEKVVLFQPLNNELNYNNFYWSIRKNTTTKCRLNYKGRFCDDVLSNYFRPHVFATHFLRAK